MKTSTASRAILIGLLILAMLLPSLSALAAPRRSEAGGGAVVSPTAPTESTAATSLSMAAAALAANAAALAAPPHPADRRPDGAPRFEVGVGMADITGPASGVGMMGYSMPDQRTGGLHTRLYARAFVIASLETGERVVFVSADQLAVFQSVHQAVLARLQARFGERYTARNTLLSATHTHAGPGGTSHFATYDLSVLGFDQKGFEVVVDGIVEAIAQADASLRPGDVRVARGRLDGASLNRSPQAQANNDPALLRSLGAALGGAGDLDREMTLLRFDAADGTPLGLLDFFSVHATSMGNDNHLISADNKGYAARGFERLINGAARAPTAPGGFVAAFAEPASGDASPNVVGGTDGGGADDFESAAISGEKQLGRARELYAQAGEASTPPINNKIDARLIYVPMDQVEVAPEFADGTARATCPAAYGLSMIAGAEDGPGFGREGETCASLSAPLRALLCRDECQAEKPVVLSAGKSGAIHFSPSVLPIQVVRVGELAFVATPFEITTAAAYELKTTALDRLAPLGVRQVIVTGPSNGYASYLTTRAEYATQNYEGASTHFGPWALGAVQQTVAGLAEAMARGAAVDPGTPPADLTGELQVELDHGDFDAAPPGRDFGDVLADVAQTLHPGETARARFVGASLNHRPTAPEGFFVVEREVNGRFVPVARDGDVETKIFWRRAACFPTFRCSEVTLEWQIPEGAPPGSYRLRYLGTRQAMGSEALTDFEGVTRVFQIQRRDGDGSGPVAARSLR